MNAFRRPTLEAALFLVLCSAAVAQQSNSLVLAIPDARIAAWIAVPPMPMILDTTTPDGAARQVKFYDADSGQELLVLLTTRPFGMTVAVGMDDVEKQIRELLGPRTEISRVSTDGVAMLSAYSPEIDGAPPSIGEWIALTREDDVWLMVQLVKIPYIKGEETPFNSIVRSIRFISDAPAPPVE